MSLYLGLVAFGVVFTMMMFQPSNGQFPTACMDDTSLQNRRCCPDNCGGNRGTCTNINIERPTGQYNNLTVRNNWPYYYTNVCKCNGNYAGFDCSRCKYGYHGSNCNKKIVLPRRSISELTPQEWDEYIDTLIMSKSHQSGYFVFLEEPTGPNHDLRTLRKTVVTSLYDLFIWQHHYAAKDNNDSALAMDYAHESTGFPTWHRQYLLWLEWELQYMLKETQPDTYHMFRLHYWDWRKELQTDANSPFKYNRLGSTESDMENGAPPVSGTLVNNGWTTRCWMLTPGMICDPNSNTGRLQRCPRIQGVNACRIDNPDWPGIDDVNNAVGMSNYDGGTYDRFSASGFRNFMEGFNLLSNDDAGRQSCSTNNLCICVDGRPQCDGSEPSQPIARLLHNSIHIILGIDFFGNGLEDGQTGVMADVAASSSDPIFVSHHAMIDCILEEWLQRNKNAQYPVNDQIHQGHRVDDYMVPFFPLVKHSEMFMTAENFGYTCRLPQVNVAIKSGPTVWLFIPVVLGMGFLFNIQQY